MTLAKINILCAVALLSFCAVAVSCSQDGLDPSQGESLKPCQYPLTFAASVDGMASRADGHNSWTDGDEIGIRIGDYPKVGHYMLNADETVMDAVDALDWQTTAPTTVKAWYPYVNLNEVMNLPIDDQTEGLDDYDFLTAVAENQTYTNTVSLNFKHQTAKVSCVLVQDDGISDEELQSAKVSFAGYTVASFTNGVLTGSYKDGSDNNKWITAFYDTKADDYEALVVPQDMTGKEFIKVELTVKANGNPIEKTLIYTANEGIAGLRAGYHNRYKITVKKDRLEVQSVSADWTDEGKWHPAEPAIFRVNMPKGHGQELIYSDNVIKVDPDYILVKGNRFDISYVVDNENIKNALIIAGDSERDIMLRDVVNNKYVFSYYLLSEEITLEYVEYIQIGDYYYDDGTWGHPKLKGIKNPVGIIFRSGAGVSGPNVDVPENYGTGLSTIHGYAVAMHDASEGEIIWGAGGSSIPAIPGIPLFSKSYDKTIYPYTGYNYTKNIVEWGKSNNCDYSAAKAATNYRMSKDDQDPNAPVKSSGWYLPTVEQLIDINNIPNRAQAFEDAQGEDLITALSKGRYWTCIVGSSTAIWIYRFNGDGVGNAVRNPSGSTQFKNNASFVRAVLTF